VRCAAAPTGNAASMASSARRCRLMPAIPALGQKLARTPT
jgi:hypothetical protein